MLTRKFTTFVSSTYEDLQEERSIVVQALLENDCIPTGMELFPASNKTSWEVIENVIRECDIYVIIVAGRYGSVDSEGVSITEREFDFAQKYKKPIFVFICKDIGNLQVKFTDNDQIKHKQLMNFRQKIEKSFQVGYYSKKEELRALVGNAIKNLDPTTITDTAGWVKIADIDPMKVPRYSLQLPDEFIVFISGASGVGKSTVSRRLISKVPRFMALEECDLLREDVRGTISLCVEKINKLIKRKKLHTKVSKEEIEKAFDLNIVESSTTTLTLSNIEKQCRWMLPAMEQKSERLNRLNMPAIFEGVGVSFNVMLNDKYFKTFVGSKDALFINLYLKDEDIHERRLRERCVERGQRFSDYEPNINHIRRNNDVLYKQTMELCRKFGNPANIINIDASSSRGITVNKIIDCIERVIGK